MRLLKPWQTAPRPIPSCQRQSRRPASWPSAARSTCRTNQRAPYESGLTVGRIVDDRGVDHEHRPWYRRYGVWGEIGLLSQIEHQVVAGCEQRMSTLA